MQSCGHASCTSCLYTYIIRGSGIVESVLIFVKVNCIFNTTKFGAKTYERAQKYQKVLNIYFF